MEETIKVPRLETERLILRAMSEKDMGFLLYHFGDDAINHYSSYESLKNINEAIEFYKRFIEAGKSTSFRLGIMLKETGKLVGTLGYHNLSNKDHRAEIGYDLSPTYWGKGIMTEAVGALLMYGFEQMNLNRIEATTDSENSRSTRLLERLGFSREGLLRDRYYYKGRFHDELMFSLLQRDLRRTVTA